MISAFGDSQFTMKLFWFIAGFSFFVCWPISSLYPRYRLLVSLFKWILWDVPNHSEWCFQYLQERAGIAREAILSHDIDDSPYIRIGKDAPQIVVNSDSETDSGASFHTTTCTAADAKERDTLSFGCIYLHTPGCFIISTTSIRFTSAVGHVLPYASFHKPYSELVEMSKRQVRSPVLSPLAKGTTGMDKLELTFRGPCGGAGIHSMGVKEYSQVVVLKNMRGQDKAFKRGD